MDAKHQDFWNNRWINKETGWDIGYPAPAITKYVEQFDDKHIAILIPGCGNAHEAQFLIEAGFSNITLIDIAPELVAQLRNTFSGQKISILCGDFFEHTGQYDLILEQTFFCAIPIAMRPQYTQKMHQLLTVNGKLAGLLFSKEFEVQGPPFGGSQEEYEAYFQPYFMIQKMELCYNSITPRTNSELFFILKKRS